MNDNIVCWSVSLSEFLGLEFENRYDITFQYILRMLMMGGSMYQNVVSQFLSSIPMGSCHVELIRYSNKHSPNTGIPANIKLKTSTIYVLL